MLYIKESSSFNVKGGNIRVWFSYEYMFCRREIKAFPSGNIYFLCKTAGKIICKREGLWGRGVDELC